MIYLNLFGGVLLLLYGIKLVNDGRLSAIMARQFQNLDWRAKKWKQSINQVGKMAL